MAPKGGAAANKTNLVVIGVVAFVAIAALSAGSGYIKTLSQTIQAQNGQISQLVGERDALSKELEEAHEGHHENTKDCNRQLGQIRKEMELTKETLERKEAMIEKNKQAAKKLATVLTKVKDQLQRVEDDNNELRKRVQETPAEDCDDAIAKKDMALAALVRERDKTDMVMEKLRRALDAKDAEITAVTQEMENKAGEMQKLSLWKEAAEEDMKRRHGLASQIWAASISDKSSKCTDPIPQLVGAAELGAMLAREKKRVGIELGITEGLAEAIVGSWHSISSYFVVETAASNMGQAERDAHDKSMRQALSQISEHVHFLHSRTLDALGQFNDGTVDLVYYTDAAHATAGEVDAIVTVLDAAWSKLLPGGLLVGGFEAGGEGAPGHEGTDMPPAWQAVTKFARTVNRQPMYGLSEHSWAIRK